MSGLRGLLERWAAIRPDDVALRVDGDGSLTFRSWHRRALGSARALAAADRGGGAHVGLHFDNASYLEYAIAYVAVLSAGAVAVPLSRALPEWEVERMAREAGASLLLRNLGDLETAPRPDGPLPDPGPDDLAEILFTSGSTGEPKAVAASYGNLAGAVALDQLTHERHGSQLHAIPLGTNWGQFALRATLSTGIGSIVMPAFDARRALELIELHRPTELLLVPPMALLLLAASAGAERDLSSIRTVRLSAAPMPAAKVRELRRVFPAATIHVGYSSTEAAPACTMMECPGDPPDTVGRPPAGHEVQVVGPDGAPLPAGRVGAIRLRSRIAPSRTYLHSRAEDRDVFDAGWVRTGDVGHLDGDGYLHLRGRASDVIDVGGYNVHPSEVEAALLEHSAVVDAAVFGIPSDVLGEQVVAAIVLSAPLAERELVRFARERLSSHKVPALIHVVDRLPRNRSCKVSKLELRKRLASVHGQMARDSDRDDFERHLLELWREALDVPDLGRDDDLAAHGADSLTVFAVLARFEVRSGMVLPPSRFLLLPTVRSQALMAVELLGSAPRERLPGRSRAVS